MAGVTGDILELDVAGRRLTTTGRLQAGAPSPLARHSSDGRWIVLGSLQGTAPLTLHDGRTGERIAVLAEDLRRASARVLSGGEIAVAGVRQETAVIQIHAADGALLRTADLGPARFASINAEPAEGELLLASLPGGTDLTWRVWVVDRGSLRVVRTLDRLRPVAHDWWMPEMPEPQVGARRSRLFLDEAGALVEVDVHTFRRKVLLQPAR
jgi:hypothetical protein